MPTGMIYFHSQNYNFVAKNMQGWYSFSPRIIKALYNVMNTQATVDFMNKDEIVMPNILFNI